MNPSKPDRPDFIRITREETTSAHVDDLLSRQRSMRGEGGITSDKRRRWYYQNWFIFMIAGTVAAFTAWALLEPFFDDLFYIQGPIERVSLTESLPDRVRVGDQDFEIMLSGQGVIYIANQKIWLLKETTVLERNGAHTSLNAGALQTGQTIGVYVEYEEAGGDSLALARFLVPSPPEPPPSKATLSLRQLAARTRASGFILFALVGGIIGLAIGAVDGIVCRLPRRALLAGAVGLLVGLLGGIVSGVLAGLLYSPLTKLAMEQQGSSLGSLSVFGFLLQVGGRSLAWGLAGITMGLGQGIALRSKRLLIYGLVGGIIGGLFGGLLFDPIDILLLGGDKPSSHVSRMIGIVLVGASVGLMIGLVELLVRDAWLRMTAGPLAGKEFIIFKDRMNIGSSPRSDIYLFNDPDVADLHATLRAIGDDCEIENRDEQHPVLLNARPLRRARLHHGDEITIGRTIFVFEKRQG